MQTLAIFVLRHMPTAVEENPTVEAKLTKASSHDGTLVTMSTKPFLTDEDGDTRSFCQNSVYLFEINGHYVTFRVNRREGQTMSTHDFYTKNIRMRMPEVGNPVTVRARLVGQIIRV